MALYQDLGPPLSEEDTALKENMHRFAKEVLRPSAIALDALSPDEVVADGSLYWDTWRQIQDLGMQSRGMPAELGGVVPDAAAERDHHGRDELGVHRLGCRHRR